MERKTGIGGPASEGGSEIGSIAEHDGRLPEHLVSLPGGQWALWRNVGLRGAGLPVTQVLGLSSGECAKAADRVLGRMEETELARGEALDLVRQELDRADRNGRKQLEKVLRHLKRGGLPEAFEAAGTGLEPLKKFQSASESLKAERDDYRRIFDAEMMKASEAIRETARADRFREAVIWQNRQALHTGIDPLFKEQAESAYRSSKLRQHEEMVASYLQRYCVKNDTIGFFGPVGWAKINSQGEDLILRPGPRLIAERNLYFEVWCIDALAEVMNKDASIREWMVPRPMPYLYFDGHSLHMPSNESIELSLQQAALIKACDGERNARQIAAELVSDPSFEFKDEAQVYSLLEDLHNKKIVSWKLEARFDLRPEQSIRQSLEVIEDADVRGRTLALLDEMESARELVRQSAGDAQRLDQALGDLDATFTRLTGDAPTRSAGLTYAGRTLVYEDCRRDVEVEIGPGLLERLGPPLSLLLESARWFSAEGANVYRSTFKEAYDKLVLKTGSRSPGLALFWYEIRQMLFNRDNYPIKHIPLEFQRRWSEILGFSAEDRRVHYTTEELRPKVAAAFRSEGYGFSFARYHSPDVLIAASSAEEVRRGNYLLVLGELHTAGNTLTWPLFVQQHRSPQEIYQSFNVDLPRTRLVPLIPKTYWDGAIARLLPTIYTPNSFYISTAPEPTHAPASRLLPIGALVVEDLGDGPVIRTRDGQMCFDLIETFDHALFSPLNVSFGILPPQPHTPRITIDDLVVYRETWRPLATELEFAYEKDEASRFIAARQWAASLGIPRFMFVKSPVEPKPFYVDLDSPVYVNLFAKAIRKVRRKNDESLRIPVTEMIPRHDEVWLADVDGSPYASELRMIAVDMTKDARAARTNECTGTNGNDGEGQ